MLFDIKTSPRNIEESSEQAKLTVRWTPKNPKNQDSCAEGQGKREFVENS